MYTPGHFAVTRIEILRELMRRHPLATLVTLSSVGLTANHIPLEYDAEPGPYGTLRGHVARGNPLWRDYNADTDALAVFQGADSYVTPGWYPTKQQSGKVVPTWNYAVVHASGPLRVIEDREWLRALVTRLTNQHEAAQSNPWKVTDAPADFIDGLLGAIIGIEIPIRNITGKWKVSQNRNEADRAGVIDGLRAAGTADARDMAGLVEDVPGDQR
ncbi:MAG: FMN-binding negative transcriptional regulator [Blastocatellia bacterium]